MLNRAKDIPTLTLLNGEAINILSRLERKIKLKKVLRIISILNPVRMD